MANSVGELAPEATHKKYLLVRKEGSRQVKRQLEFKEQAGAADAITALEDISKYKEQGYDEREEQ